MRIRPLILCGLAGRFFRPFWNGAETESESPMVEGTGQHLFGGAVEDDFLVGTPPDAVSGSEQQPGDEAADGLYLHADFSSADFSPLPCSNQSFTRKNSTGQRQFGVNWCQFCAGLEGQHTSRPVCAAYPRAPQHLRNVLHSTHAHSCQSRGRDTGYLFHNLR